MSVDIETRRKQGRAAQRRHYQKNKQYYVDRAIKRKQELREWYRALKASLSCIQCGEQHVACLSFHHRDRAEKFMEIYRMVHLGYSQKRILAEMDKCDVLCENCHRKVEWKLQRTAE